MDNKVSNRKCSTCRYFRRYMVKDAYGNKYQAIRCINVKSPKEKVKGGFRACRYWARKNMPTSGDYCYFIKDRINYKEDTPKTQLPCYNCNARCRFSFNKEEKDFTQRNKKIMFMEDIENL